MAGAVADYISRLERELQRRGVGDARMLAEAREHLLDAVEEGRQQGLSADDAERNALERFGAPEIVAAQMLAERDRTMTGFAGALRMAWQRKWWILVPTACTAIVAAVLSPYLLPTRYLADVTVLAVPQRVPTDYVRSTPLERPRLPQISAILLTGTHLESIIEELGLYQVERQQRPLSEVVERMRNDIRVAAVHADVFRVSFVSPDPGTAMKVADRLANVLRDQGTRIQGSEVLPDGSTRTHLAFTGDQFRILDARFAQPIGPGRWLVTVIGSLAGLAIGFALAVLRRSSNGGVQPTLAEA